MERKVVVNKLYNERNEAMIDLQIKSTFQKPYCLHVRVRCHRLSQRMDRWATVDKKKERENK